MNRRAFFGIALGAALAGPLLLGAAKANDAVAASSASIRYLRLPPTLALVRQLYLAPGEFTTPTHLASALVAEELGYIVRTFADTRGVWWTLTDLGRAKGAELVRDYPDGVLAVVTQAKV